MWSAGGTGPQERREVQVLRARRVGTEGPGRGVAGDTQLCRGGVRRAGTGGHNWWEGGRKRRVGREGMGPGYKAGKEWEAGDDTQGSLGEVTSRGRSGGGRESLVGWRACWMLNYPSSSNKGLNSERDKPGRRLERQLRVTDNKRGQ